MNGHLAKTSPAVHGDGDGNIIWTRTGAQGSFHFENVHLIGNRQAVCEKILPTCGEMNCELKLGKCLASNIEVKKVVSRSKKKENE